MAFATAHQSSSAHSTTFEPISTTPASTGSSTKRNVNTQLNYYLETGAPPKPTIVGKPETFAIPAHELPVTINDISGEVDKFTLDKNGFQIVTRPSVEKSFDDDEQIKAQYYPETEKLLKDVTGASRVHIFDHTIRRAQKDQRNPNQPLRGPVNRVHIDQSYESARARVSYHLPEEFDKLLKTRYQIINVWRPIKPVQRDPLAIADAFSVPESDLVPVPMVYPDRTGETLSIRPNSEHKWYYLHGQTPDVVTLIKCYDSKLDGRARRVAHTAFAHAETGAEEARQSIEMRAMVFHEDESAE